MSIELIDKEVSTDDLDDENVEEKEIEEQISKEKEKKERTDLEKLEVVLSVLVENKVMSIRNTGKKVKERNFPFSKFRNKLDEGDGSKTRTNSSATLVSSSRHDCRQTRCRSLIPKDSTEYCPQVFSKYPKTSTDSPESSNPLYSHHHHLHHHHHHHHHDHPQHNRQQSFDSYDVSLYYKPSESPCCGHGATDLEHRLERKKLPVQKCLPKQLSTEQWLNSTSRQTSTETATTSSGYISPTFGTDTRRHRFGANGADAHHMNGSTEATSNGDSETIIDMSKLQAQKTLDAIEESKSVDKTLADSRSSFAATNELEQLKGSNSNNNSNSKVGRVKCNESCHVFLPQCLSTTCLPTCKYAMVEDQGCYNDAPYRHVHPSGGHYMSCYNSPTHSFQRYQYDDNYLTLAMNLEDLEFEEEEERRKKRKRRKKRRKERQIRARGLMADELKNAKKASKVLDPEDLPKRARWTIVATACLLLIMSMLLVGVTLRMAPIIDEMVRKENEEMLHSLSRQGAVKEATNITKTSTSTLGNSSNRL